MITSWQIKNLEGKKYVDTPALLELRPFSKKKRVQKKRVQNLDPTGKNNLFLTHEKLSPDESKKITPQFQTDSPGPAAGCAGTR